jgi:tetratricopeptide (TPR) repeat protein
MGMTKNWESNGRFYRPALALLVLAGLLLPGVALAQDPPPPPPPQPGEQQEPKPEEQPRRPWDPPAEGAEVQPGTPPVDPAEDADYWAFLAAPAENTQRVIELGEAFLEKYQESRYRQYIYARMANAYLATNQPEKMIAAGEKALELNPDNVDVLSLLAWVMPRRVGRQGLDTEQVLQKSENYSKHAIELLENMERPDTLSEEDFNRARDEKLSMCHSGLGLVFFHRQRFADSAAAFEKATALSPSPEPVDFYVLGLAYANTNRFSEAATAFGRCADINWDWQDRCRSSQEEARQRAAGQLQPPTR